MEEEIETSSFTESQQPDLLWIVPWKRRVHGYKSPMFLLVGTPGQRSPHCPPCLEYQVDKGRAAPRWELKAYPLNIIACFS